jgi:hypothetical protein
MTGIVKHAEHHQSRSLGDYDQGHASAAITIPYGWCAVSARLDDAVHDGRGGWGQGRPDGGMKDLLNPEKALIFRITHRDNLPWIFRNGLHCRNANRIDPNYVSIGNADLIANRHHHGVPVPPGGSLSEYIPFYFTPLSMMSYNIKTGYRGVTQRHNEEIVILVSSLRKLAEDGIPFLFTDRHAYLGYASCFNDLGDLARIDWAILQNRDFKKDSENPEKTDRYQAEALVHRHVPISSLRGVVCYNTIERDKARKLAEDEGVDLSIISQRGWYF